ncbi:unnamed protein product (macronuclear) [Paramecium tetraurelia]|uniref:Transmembrane protein n=1 Tax=Paramecium tetraurelia TaxID=5888 RepID=A0BM52_PARTE|nr:uncharacterized protein GSPATT00030253001 [Paramecium tetraurelia]CAK59619.1 unnamed protein product [Paramecium tetraurelia]|eukprot:XP_001427017.1 hypothetical protein (macronuclear) [Paramecium tetraurelia strain d4-2]
MQFTLKLAFILAYLQETLSQTCRLQNTEYNLLTIVNGETFRLPLNDYFIGDGLSYTIQPQNSPFAEKTVAQGQESIKETIISTTSSYLNNNPNTQGSNYYALAQLTGGGYYILSQFQTGAPYIQKNYNHNFGYIAPGPTCFSINFIQNEIMITCSAQGTNQLTYLFYTIDQNPPQLLLQSQTINSNTIQAGAYVTTQAVGQYIVTLINTGTYKTGTYFSTYSELYVFQLSLDTPQQFNFNQIQIPSPLVGTDYYTGISLQENGILFITTYQSGLAYLNLNTVPNQLQFFNPFSQGTLGVSSYSVDYSSSFFYLAIWNAEGIVAGVYNSASQVPFKTAQVIQTNQITQTQMFATQVFMNPRFLVAVNSNGISVYPSILNDINNWQLLYYIPSNVLSSAFDYYNNILVTVAGQNVITYQFNNPIVTTSNLATSAGIQNFTITATPSMFGGAKTSQPCSLILYYNVTSPIQTVDIFQAYQVNSAKETFVQWGPLFNLYLGSIQTVNINKMLIGPAIIAGFPTTNAAYSNIDIQFSNVLSTPSLNSPYRINSNLIVGQKILYSQMFYDASYIVNDKLGEQFKDTYLQLVQVSNYIVLFQCQGFEDQPCTQIVNIPNNVSLIEQFALSFSSSNLINIAYMWNDFNVKDQNSIGHITICQVGYHSTVTNQNCKTQDFNSKDDGESPIKALQISLAQDSFYILFQQTADQVTTNYFSAFNVQEYFSSTSDILALQSYLNSTSAVSNTTIKLSDYTIDSFTQNIPAYGNIIFLNAWNSVTNGDITNYYYYLIAINYNGGYLNINGQYVLNVIGAVQTNKVTTSPLTNYYQFTVDGMYLLQINTKGSPTLTFYPRVDLLPSLFFSYQQTNPPQQPVNGISLQTYGLSHIVQVTSSARFLYIMGQPEGSNTYSIYVYKNTPSSQNALYYVISTDANDQIIDAPFSVTSAIQYDGILFKSRGNDGYRNSLLLPEFEFVVKCNLNSNFQQQIEYSYVLFKAQSIVKSGSKLSQTAQEYWATFESVNLVSFSKETSTIANAGSISTSGFTQVDPRAYFQGNIQSFLLSNGTNSTTFYYFNITSPVERQPQTTNYQYPVTAVSAYMQISDSTVQLNSSNQQSQYWFTFVQTDRLVYVTPYFYYSPPEDFADNSTVKIDYPLIYKLPVLDIAPNSQKCPLIFVDPGSNGIVSVCGTKVANKFAASFTLFNPLNQEVMETKLIMLDQAFPILGQTTLTNNGSYQLQTATYLDIGVVVLQFQYTYNFGSSPPTIIILPFLYTSNLHQKIASYPSNPTLYFYQFIQPIQQVYQVPSSNLGSSISVTAFALTTIYLGNQNEANQQTFISFGFLCVSDIKEECLIPYTQGQTQTPTSGVVIQVTPRLLNTIFSSTLLVSFSSPNNIYLATQNPFQISLLNIVSDYTQNSVQQVIQAGAPLIQNGVISEVPLIAVSQGTAYIFKLQFYLSNAQYIQSLYACTLLGLSDQNRILQISASSSNTGQYQVVAIIANPTASVNNQVTLLNYGFINQQCSINPTAVSTTVQPTKLQDGLEVLVTAIGATTYVSAEATPVLALMQPPAINNQVIDIARTLISDNQVITLLDTSPYLTISAYPNYNLKGGVSLNSTNLFSSSVEPLITSISAMSVQTYINNLLISGEGGSTLFEFSISQIPVNSTFPDSVWDRKLWGQFIWGSIMFIIIVGIIGYLFYKSQPLPYDRF